MILRKKIKILYIHQYFSLPDGLSGIRSYKNAIALQKQGFSVTIICLSNYLDKKENKSILFKEVIYFEGIKIIKLNINYSNYMGFIKRSIAFIKFSLCATWEALFGNYEIIFATSTPLTVSIPGILAKILLKKKFLFEVRDSWPEFPRSMGILKNDFLYLALLFLEIVSYKLSDFCIGLSPGICSRIKQIGKNPKKIKFMPNSSDLEIFKPLSDQSMKDPSLINKNFNKDDFVVAFTGAHGIANGLESVLDIALILKRKKIKNIKFLFIGKGKCKPKLLKIKDQKKLNNCIFMDPIPKLKLASLMKDSVHVGLMTLKNIECFYMGTSPNKFFDYLAAGLPVINNYPGWIADIIKKYNMGIVVDPDDPIAFSNALINISEDLELRNIMSKNAREIAEKNFSREKQQKEIINIFKEISINL